ncbi:transposable element Tcb2 transposase [Trichonephila clavipes]|nr:transposable element Tcb2 transposase [Trichonephila clavipes]
MLNRLTELHVFNKGSVNGDRYCKEEILPHVRLFRGAIGPDFVFIEGNAQPHRVTNIQQLLESEDITRTDWSAFSLDLSPIEHVWDALGERLMARLHPPGNTPKLYQMLIEE